MCFVAVLKYGIELDFFLLLFSPYFRLFSMHKHLQGTHNPRNTSEYNNDPVITRDTNSHLLPHTSGRLEKIKRQFVQTMKH